MFRQITQINARPAQAAEKDPSTDMAQRIFRAMHGQYGNLFLSKFATGEVVHGEDAGVVSAMQQWGHGLRRYDEQTVRAALTQCLVDHTEYPPNLPQFLKICEARRPREAYQPRVIALPVDPALVAKRGAEAREKLASMAEEMRRRDAAGLTPLKQAIANAVATAGGNEATELVRLDRLLSQGAAHV